MGADREFDNGPDVCTERSPLLGVAGEERARGPGEIEPPHRPSHQSRTPSEWSSIVPKVHNNQAILNMFCAIYFVGASAGGFTSVPLTKIVEDVVCHRHYGSGEPSGELIDEKLCKIEPIQTKVAFVFAITGMCEAAVGFLAAFPWGIVADRQVFSNPPPHISQL
ncbi:hypothetical protein FQN54_005712 [Arachnomyces sp. PD_36]|nr:hypothetical protein FQN54_005712 [Arachnomyces sp. PD_36]